MDKYIKGVMLPANCELAVVIKKERCVSGWKGVLLTMINRNPYYEVSKREATTSDNYVTNGTSFVDFLHDINSGTNNTSYSVVGSKGTILMTFKSISGILNGFNKNYNVTAFIQHNDTKDIIMFTDPEDGIKLTDLELDFF